MSGFFDDELEDVEAPIVIARKSAGPKAAVKAAVSDTSCEACGLCDRREHSHRTAQGRGARRILVLGPIPKADTPHLQAGESHRELRSILSAAGISLDRDCWYLPALRASLDDEKFTDQIEQSCRRETHDWIKEHRPSVVVSLGSEASHALLDWDDESLHGVAQQDLYGVATPLNDLGCWNLNTWSLRELMESQYRGAIDPVMARQIRDVFKQAFRLADTPIPTAHLDWKSRLVPVYNPQEACVVLRRLVKVPEVAVDYETTGRKPEAPGHEIWTASVSDGQTAWAFPMFKDKAFREAWQALLESPVKKITHNGKFEQRWTHQYLGYWIKHCSDDTMLNAHCLRNRQMRTNLGIEVFRHFGVGAWDTSISHFLKSSKKDEELYGANAQNRVREAPMGPLLEYNAADALWTFWLAQAQRKLLTEHQRSGTAFFVRSSRMLARAESEGLHMDPNDAAGVRKELKAEMDSIEAATRELPEIRKKWAAKVEDEFRMSAAADTSRLLFDVLGRKPTKFTAKGGVAADKAALEDHVDLEVIRNVLQWRKLQKMESTYIQGFLRENVGGVVRPFFNLHNVDTYRSSSDSPNFQNIPKRDKKAAAPLRRILKPFPNQKLAEYDYKAVEVCVSACYNKDPNLIRYIKDPTSDMHRDTGMELFMKTAQELTKDDRSVAKNGFVFPEFYGSYYEQVAPDLWFKMADATKEHLAAKGVRSLRDFTRHVQDIEAKFWGERFPVYDEWKKKTYALYQKQGYLDSYTGFRVGGPMRRNEAVNYCIQGSAFHCLLWTLTHVNEVMEEKDMASCPIGQIHDAGVLSVDPAEEMYVDHLMYDWGTQKIREAWSWLIVPLTLEKEISAVNGNWAEMVGCGALNA